MPNWIPKCPWKKLTDSENLKFVREVFALDYYISILMRRVRVVKNGPLLAGLFEGMIVIMLLVASGCTPSIHDAIARGNVEVVKSLLDKDPDLVKAVDGKGKTPLHSAVTYKRMDVMELLLDKGADIGARDITGMTPLHVAAMLGRSDEAKWLLEHGADPEVKDDYGDMPIHTAAIFGNGQIIGLFVSQGMSPDIPNGEGQTPEDIAREYRQERVVAYIAHLRNRK